MFTCITLLATSSYLFAGRTGILTLVADNKTINVSNYDINDTGTENNVVNNKKLVSKSKIEKSFALIGIGEETKADDSHSTGNNVCTQL